MRDLNRIHLAVAAIVAGTFLAGSAKAGDWDLSPELQAQQEVDQALLEANQALAGMDEALERARSILARERAAERGIPVVTVQTSVAATMPVQVKAPVAVQTRTTEANELTWVASATAPARDTVQAAATPIPQRTFVIEEIAPPACDAGEAALLAEIQEGDLQPTVLPDRLAAAAEVALETPAQPAADDLPLLADAAHDAPAPAPEQADDPVPDLPNADATLTTELAAAATETSGNAVGGEQFWSELRPGDADTVSDNGDDTALLGMTAAAPAAAEDVAEAEQLNPVRRGWRKLLSSFGRGSEQPEADAPQEDSAAEPIAATAAPQSADNLVLLEDIVEIPGTNTMAAEDLVSPRPNDEDWWTTFRRLNNRDAIQKFEDEGQAAEATEPVEGEPLQPMSEEAPAVEPVPAPAPTAKAARAAAAPANAPVEASGDLPAEVARDIRTLRFSNDYREQIQARERLVGRGASVLPAVQDLLQESVTTPRIHAVLILREIGTPEAVASLFNLLSDDDPQVRCHANLALVKRSGHTVGYHYLDSAQARGRATDRWQTLLTELGLLGTAPVASRSAGTTAETKDKRAGTKSSSTQDDIKRAGENKTPWWRFGSSSAQESPKQ